ncbi:hypothetical protein SH449x_003050 [Pirellulaceae bacterium SH449]
MTKSAIGLSLVCNFNFDLNQCSIHLRIKNRQTFNLILATDRRSGQRQCRGSLRRSDSPYPSYPDNQYYHMAVNGYKKADGRRLPNGIAHSATCRRNRHL